MQRACVGQGAFFAGCSGRQGPVGTGVRAPAGPIQGPPPRDMKREVGPGIPSLLDMFEDFEDTSEGLRPDMSELWFDELSSAPIASPLRCEVCSPVRSAEDAGSLYFPAEESIPPALCRHVFGYDRDLEGRYKKGKRLGQGTYGVVRRAEDLATGEEVAVKSIPKVKEVWTGSMDGDSRAGTTSKYLQRLQNEVNVLARLKSVPGVVDLYKPFEDDTHIHLVMELCSGTTLDSYMKKEGQVDENLVADIIRSILKVVAACHSQGIIYRDLKPANFLFKGSDPGSGVVCCDFGVAANFLPGEPEPLTQRTGTPVYMAPEVILKQYGQEADLWSAGMVLYQLLFGELPFWGGSVPEKMPLKDIFFEIMLREIDYSKAEEKGISPEALNLCQGLLRRDPEQRLSARQAFFHPFLALEKERGTGMVNWNMG